MLLLFVDTETSGVNFTNDKIIEVAGVIIDFDTKSFSHKEILSFDSLVNIKLPLDPKISRITGITDNDLKSSLNLYEVQDKWANWLTPYLGKVEAIIGHSINFDLNFLNKESWLLPDKFKIVDTLDLTKILLPQVSAVNLEFLIEKLKLNNVTSSPEDKKMLPHRSYFDTKICINLFIYLIQILNNYNFSQRFHKYILNNFLALDLNFYTQPDSVSNIPNTQNKQADIDFNGNLIKLNFNQKLNSLNFQIVSQKIENLFEIEAPQNLKLLIAQIYALSFIKARYPSFQMKLHGQEKSTAAFAGLVVNYISGEIQEPDLDSTFTLSYLESLINNIQIVAETTSNIAEIINHLEIYIELLKYHNTSVDLLQKLQKIINSYDFFIYSMSSFWRNGEFVYSPATDNFENRSVNQKLVGLVIALKDILTVDLDSTNILLKILGDKITDLAVKLIFYTQKESILRLNFNGLTINYLKQDFNLKEHLEKILTKYPKLEIQTFLSLESFKKLLGILNITDLQDKLNVKYFIYDIKDYDTQIEVVENVGLNDFYEEKLSLAKQTQKPVIFLGGQNSSLRDAERIFTQNINPKDYLLLGESGSLTKVGSKLVREFVGLVFVKLKDYNYLNKLTNIPKFEEVWFVNQPYLYLHSFWRSKAKQSGSQEEYLSDLKKLYLESELNRVSYISGVKVKFLRSYKT